MTAPAKILELVERFDRNIDAYKQEKYNEAQVRKEFIDPFFKELGWDVDNEKGYAEAYKDVVHEDAIRHLSYFQSAPSISPTPPTKLATTRWSPVERMLELHRQLAGAKTPQAKTVLQRQIEATDHLVYELYDLNEEEIKIMDAITDLYEGQSLFM